jgi:hypothetical protein
VYSSADTQTLSQLGQAEGASMHDHEAHNAASNAGETLTLEDQAHLLNEFNDYVFGFICHK